jgi:hypothetical protein
MIEAFETSQLRRRVFPFSPWGSTAVRNYYPQTHLICELINTTISY